MKLLPEHFFAMPMIRYFLLVLSIAFSFDGAAQDNIDSLFAEAKKEKSAQEMTSIYAEIGTYYTFINLDSSIYYFDKAIKMGKTLKEDSLLAETYIRIGRTLIYAGIYDRALQYMYDASMLVESDLLKIRILINIGTVHYRKYDFDRALENYAEAERLMEKNKNLLGNNYFIYFASLMNNIGIIYDNTNRYDSALLFYSRGLNYSRQGSDSVVMGNLYANIGKIYQYQGKHDLAKSNLLEGFAIRKAIHDNYGVARSYGHIGSLFLAMQEHDSARFYLVEGVKKAVEIGSPETECYTGLLLAEANAHSGNYKEAYRLQVKYKALMDSLNTITDTKMITQIEMQYAFDKKEREEAIARQRKEFWITSIIVVLALVIVVVVLFFILQRIRTKNEQLQKERFSLANKNLLLEKGALEKNLEYKNKELTTNVMYLMKKNELLNDVSQRLLEIRKSSRPEEKEKIYKIIVELNSATNDDVWQDFELRFNEVYNDFYERLMKQFPHLTSNDRKLCAFLRLNLSSKEICAITRQSINSLNVSRARLRKKLGIDNSDTDLISFLEKI